MKNIAKLILVAFVGILMTACGTTKMVVTPKSDADLVSFGRGGNRQVFSQTVDPVSGDTAWQAVSTRRATPAVQQMVAPVAVAPVYDGFRAPVVRVGARVQSNVYYTPDTYTLRRQGGRWQHSVAQYGRAPVVVRSQAVGYGGRIIGNGRSRGGNRQPASPVYRQPAFGHGGGITSSPRPGRVLRSSEPRANRPVRRSTAVGHGGRILPSR